MKHRLILTISFAWLIANMPAQEAFLPRHEIGASFGGGISSLQYSPEGASHDLGFGGQAGIGYRYFFSEHWGVTTGVDFNLFTAKSVLNNNFKDAYNTVTGNNSLMPGTPFEFGYSLTNYKEKQQAFYLTIPFMLQFQTTGKHKYYAALGGKAGFPVSTKYKATDYTLATQGYFPDYGRTIDDLPEYGLGEYANLSNEGDLDFNMACFISLETGIKWKIGGNNALYTGIYVDYGLNNIQKKNDQLFVGYKEGMDLPMNSLVQSRIKTGAVTDKINPLAIGVKITFTLGRGNIKSKQKPLIKQTQPIIPDDSHDLAEKEKQEEFARQQAEADRIAAEQQRKKYQADMKTLSVPVESYSLGTVTLDTAQKQELDQKIEILERNASTNVLITGHTCDIGSEETNIRIGQQRADSAKDYMVEKGIAPNRVITASKGETQPLVPNTSEVNRMKNRRIEIEDFPAD